jgi:hypothetical protein
MAFRRKLTAAIAFFLNRRARDRSVGAVDTALTLDGLHAVAASLTVVDVLTGISRQQRTVGDPDGPLGVLPHVGHRSRAAQSMSFVEIDNSAKNEL